MKQDLLARTLLATALALALASCGGGGGGAVRSDAPATSPPPTTSPPPPTSPPPTSPPTSPPQPAFDAHLTLTNALEGRASGYTGAGYRIGVVDTGVNRDHPALAGRVVANYTYVDPAQNDLSVDDVVGHGTTVAMLAAGAAVGDWPGGIAPGAEIVSARIIYDEEPDDDGSGSGNEVDGSLGLAGVHADLIAAGVKIMNNSWGGLYWSDPSVTAAIASDYRAFVVDNGGLVLFATGNDGESQPSQIAALPSQVGPGGTLPAAYLEQGWLAVAALDTSNPTQLESYSNACGVAMRYCLVAPGTVVFTGADDTASSISYYYGSGTSYATPLVSGAAALVWQKFPYFSNDLVRQTLLGTATDLGAAGVDPVFGYGLLNIGKAMRGPARFDWGDVHVVLPAGASEPWWNDISGDGGLIVDGGGVTVTGGTDDPSLTIEGNNTFSGGLTITGGATVAINGAMASDVVVDPGSYLYAWQVDLTGTLTNNGVVQINSSPNVSSETVLAGNVVNNGVFFNRDYPHTTLGGDFTQSASGEFWVVLGTDPLHIAGTASLDGGLYVYSAAQGYVAHDHTEVMVADGGVQGQFAWAGYNSGSLLLDATVGYDSTSVWLDVTRADVVAAASSLSTATAASLGSATRVESAFQQLDAQQLQPASSSTVVASQAFVQGAAQIQQAQGASALQATLDSLSGSVHAEAMAMTFDSIDASRRSLSSHLAGLAPLRPGQSEAWMQRFDEPGHGGLFGRGFAGGGWMMGQDVRLASGAVVGLAFGQIDSYRDAGASLDRGHDRQSLAQVYALWKDGPAYLLGQFGAGRYTRNIERELLLGTASYGVASRYGGQFVSASIESGYRFAGGISPYLGLDHAQVSGDAFSEQGGYGFGLRSADLHATRSQALAGLRVERSWAGIDLSGFAEWQQLLASDGLAFEASFVGIDSWAPLRSAATLRSGGVLGVSAGTWLSPGARLSFGYDQQFGPRGEDRALSLRYSAGF